MWGDRRPRSSEADGQQKRAVAEMRCAVSAGPHLCSLRKPMKILLRLCFIFP